MASSCFGQSRLQQLQASAHREDDRRAHMAFSIEIQDIKMRSPTYAAPCGLGGLSSASASQLGELSGLTSNFIRYQTQLQQKQNRSAPQKHTIYRSSGGDHHQEATVTFPTGLTRVSLHIVSFVSGQHRITLTKLGFPVLRL